MTLRRRPDKKAPSGVEYPTEPSHLLLEPDYPLVHLIHRTFLY